MPGTEIEDIFSGKASTRIEPKAVSGGVGDKRKTLKSGAIKSTTVGDGEGKKRQKKKKGKERDIVASYKRDEKEVEGTSGYEAKTENQEGEKTEGSSTKKSKKRPRDEVEEVVDPSITVKKLRLEKDGKHKKSKGEGMKTGLDKFMDSRGSGGRKRTEEGYPIYTEEELGIMSNNKGGDTALCPFDCDCCY